MRKKIIFIASRSCDGPALLVAAKLQNLGYHLVFYKMDDVYAKSKLFTTQLNKSGKLTLEYDGHQFEVQDIKAAWYRRPANLSRYIEEDSLRRIQIQRNIRMLQDGIFANFPERVWLNDPFIMRKAEGKVYQLAAALSVGFTVPPTTITNTWEHVLRLSAKEVIVKMPFAVLENGPETPDKIFYTTRLRNKQTELPTDATPFPGIWQPYIQKRKEWRITVIGQQLFAATIYTSKHAQHDWREHQGDVNKVRFCAEEFPKAEQQKCFALLKKLGLRYGAFDFIETPEGEIIFLEVNPNGQYGWLEDELGFPISKAIADELLRIASTGRV